MNLFVEYMSFDVSWFTTPAGILITVGFVIFIIGFALYLASGLKKSDDSGENVTKETPANDAVNIPVASEPVVEDIKATEEVVVPTPAVLEENVVANELPVVETQPIVEENPTVEESPVVEAQPIVEENPTVEESPVVEAQPIVEEQLVVENTSEPEVVLNLDSNEEKLPVVEDVQAVEEEKDSVVVPTVENTMEPVSIYGGANPQVSVVKEEPKQIYGGADPLENTGALPRVEVPAEPVSESVPVVEELPSVEPVAEDVVVPEPQQEKKPLTATPTDDVETLEF